MKDFKECICEVIGSGSSPSCLPEGAIATKAKKLKAANCVNVATKDDFEAHRLPAEKARLRKLNPNAPAEAVDQAAAKESKRKACVSAKRIALNTPGKDGFVMVAGSMAQTNEYLKKAAINDECSDLIIRPSEDPALKDPPPSWPPLQKAGLKTLQEWYIALKSHMADQEYIESLEPKAPPAGSSQAEQDAYEKKLKDWLTALQFNTAEMGKYLKGICTGLATFAGDGKTPANTSQLAEIKKCKDKAPECRNRAKARLEAAGRRDC